MKHWLTQDIKTWQVLKSWDIGSWRLILSVYVSFSLKLEHVLLEIKRKKNEILII